MKLKITLLILTVVLSITAITALSTYAHRVENNASEYKTDYILMTYGENVAVYKNGKLIEIFDTVLVDSLPEYDRNQLKNGMNFKNINEIYTIIEDFDG